MSELSASHKLTILKACRADAAFHVEKIQGVDSIEPHQRKILEAVTKYNRICIRAVHGIGKSWTIAKVVLWFTSTFPGSRAIITAPTAKQVRLILWAEIRAGYSSSKFPLGGKMFEHEWKIAPDWYAVGFTSRVEAGSGSEGQGAASTFQGYHAEYVLVVFDEATGIHPQIWEQAEGLLTSGKVIFIAIGNPTSQNTNFFKCFQSPLWHKIKLTCFDSPNLAANGIHNMDDLQEELRFLADMSDDERLSRISGYKIVHSRLVTLQWVISYAVKVGVDHPLFVSKALGEFPDDDDFTLMPLGTVERAQMRQPPADDDQDVCLGIDCARGGMDTSVITVMRGVKVTHRFPIKNRANKEVSGKAISFVNDCLLEEMNVRTIVVDETGIGSGVLEDLIEYQQNNFEWKNVQVLGVNFGEKFSELKDGSDAEEKDKRFVNRKAEMFVELGDDLKETICLLDDDVYLEELPTIIYKIDGKGKYQIEDKARYKARTGRGSPDSSDSLAMCNWGRRFKGTVASFLHSSTGRAYDSDDQRSSAINAEDQW